MKNDSFGPFCPSSFNKTMICDESFTESDDIYILENELVWRERVLQVWPLIYSLKLTELIITQEDSHACGHMRPNFTPMWLSTNSQQNPIKNLKSPPFYKNAPLRGPLLPWCVVLLSIPEDGYFCTFIKLRSGGDHAKFLKSLH